MKSTHRFIHILAVLLAFPSLGTIAGGATIELLETFDYPGTGNLTRPQKINDAGEIVGEFVDSSGAVRGFTRSRDGVFSAPIIEPNDTANFTEGRGINNSDLICGDYSDGVFHGFFLSGGAFTEFNIADSLSTNVLGINDANDFVGNFTAASDGIGRAFISLGGNLTQIDVPGSTFSASYQLNASNQLVGYYADSAGITHGFFQNRDGTLVFPIDPATSTGTILFGNNDQNWVVGRYADSAGVTHGLFFIGTNHFVTFDFPGSTFTSLNGINRRGFICGRYLDAAGIEHGILARVRPGRADKAGHEMRANRLPVSPVKPAGPVPSAQRTFVPAS